MTPAPCGCRVQQRFPGAVPTHALKAIDEFGRRVWILPCPLHQAAEAMRDALAEALEWLSTLRMPQASVECQSTLTGSVVKGQQALAKARGET